MKTPGLGREGEGWGSGGKAGHGRTHLRWEDKISCDHLGNGGAEAMEKMGGNPKPGGAVLLKRERLYTSTDHDALHSFMLQAIAGILLAPAHTCLCPLSK